MATLAPVEQTPAHRRIENDIESILRAGATIQLVKRDSIYEGSLCSHLGGQIAHEQHREYLAALDLLTQTEAAKAVRLIGAAYSTAVKDNVRNTLTGWGFSSNAHPIDLFRRETTIDFFRRDGLSIIELGVPRAQGPLFSIAAPNWVIANNIFERYEPAMDQALLNIDEAYAEAGNEPLISVRIKSKWYW